MTSRADLARVRAQQDGVAGLRLERAPEPSVPPELIRWLDDAAIAELPDLEYLVPGVLTRPGLAGVFGARGSGKTLLAMDLAYSIGTGHPWHGHATPRGPVVYLLAEGRTGLKQRRAAWFTARDLDPDGAYPIHWVPQPVPFLEPTVATALLADVEAFDPPPLLVVVDTLSWCISPGDESAQRDMGLYNAVCAQLRDGIGATVLSVHHIGHLERDRPRGAYAWEAGLDTLIKCSSAGGQLTLTCEKQRDAVPFEPLTFRLAPFGDSLAPELVVGASSTSGEEPLTSNEQRCLEALRELCEVDHSVPFSRWEAMAAVPHGSFDRARVRLIKRGLVRKDGKAYVPTASDEKVPGPNAVPF